MSEKSIMGENTKSILLFIVCSFLSFLITIPQTRNALLALQQSDKRNILATLEYSTGKDILKVIKLEVAHDIFVEIYRLNQAGQQSLMAQFAIPYSRDTHFGSQSSLSNLFQTNLDDDKENEIIVPVIDENLVSQFTVIKYDRNSNTFSQFNYIAPL